MIFFYKVYPGCIKATLVSVLSSFSMLGAIACVIGGLVSIFGEEHNIGLGIVLVLIGAGLVWLFFFLRDKAEDIAIATRKKKLLKAIEKKQQQQQTNTQFSSPTNNLPYRRN